MRIKFISNAALDIITSDTQILCDPWLIPGAFDGSWYHAEPLFTRPESLDSYTHIYISHIHPDHCDMRTLRLLKKKDVPVIILKSSQKFLHNAIKRAGFHKILEVGDQESIQLTQKTNLTMYKAFAPNAPFEDAMVPNVIDSSIVVESDNQIILNSNDNTPTPEACSNIRDRFGEIDCALLPYSGAGPYPSCYLNLSEKEKEVAAESKNEAFLNRLIDNCSVLKPKCVIPIAGEMLLGGRQYHKNKYIGLPSRKRVMDLLSTHDIYSHNLGEGDEYDLDSGEVKRSQETSTRSQSSYESWISQELFWWEKAFSVPPDEQIDLLPLLKSARDRMWQYQNRVKFTHESWVIVEVSDLASDHRYFGFPMDSDQQARSLDEQQFNSLSSSEAYLKSVVPYNYLIALLTRHGHWNNAYHGCIADWLRDPDDYRPEIQNLMSFLHL